MKFDQSMFKEKNRLEFQDSYDAMSWVTRDQARAALEKRDRLLDSIFRGDGRAKWRFARTKPHTGELSPGCQLCGEGDWSCLFVNNLCNASCFYCPSAQKNRSVPGTGNLEFNRPESYANYVNAFGIKGVSFSGGEPTLSFDRVVSLLKTLGRRSISSLYIWMYTNGILITEDKLKVLRDQGLDEIRFDIGAVGYNLEKVKMAIGVIPRVTVEVPAVPEDVETLKRVVKDLDAMGVDFLNLHQLRCTGYNREKFIRRNYTFVHGPGVAVLETELAALEIMAHTLDQEIDLPVNYCSFIYRHQFQGAGGRRRNAMIVKKGYEDVTRTGYIRSMALGGSTDAILGMHHRLMAADCDPGLWQVSETREQLLFSSEVWKHLDFSGLTLGVSYVNTRLRQTTSYRYSFQEVRLNSKYKVIIERQVEPGETTLNDEMIGHFFDRFIAEKPRANHMNNPMAGLITNPMESKDALAEIEAHENFRYGLLDYF
ncbi:MAG: radical SAM protein [Desulfobacterium sp.]|jgi:pyruvate formate-lyase activating enzyme-like uncharacterized protein|nr:radical SAM protein [Desulfobacterium sp.]